MRNKEIRTAHFSSLLTWCSDPQHKNYEEAWYEFDRRYRKQILNHIQYHLHRWHKSQDEHIAEEILTRIAERFIANDFRALKTLRNRKSEETFKSFLNIICRNATHAVMVSMIKRREMSLEDLLDANASEIQPSQGNIRAIFEDLVRELRAKLIDSNKPAYFVERDILVYLLRYVAGFKAKEVASLALLNINPGHIENVMNRLNRLLR